jgi:hypothetical protein
MNERMKRLIGTTIGPGAFMGTTWGTYWALLRDNRFRVNVRYWPRAIVGACCSVANSLACSWEHKRFDSLLAGVRVEPPVFVLGFPRSGTTHLQNLFSIDSRFAFPNTFQAFFPNTFLTAGRLGPKIWGAGVPRVRPMDNMAVDRYSPCEDELAVGMMTMCSPTAGSVFPRRLAHYERFLTFRGMSEDEQDRWCSAFELFLKKLTYLYGRPLVLKSPTHMGKIATLLNAFPQARFVHIHRDPYTVFQSNRRLIERTLPLYQLQPECPVDLNGFILRRYTTIHNAFFEALPSIPKHQFCEVAFHDLESDPIGQMRRVYEELGLPDFATVELPLARYVASLEGYRKNRFEPLDESLRDRIAQEWKPSFDRWGYQP